MAYDLFNEKTVCPRKIRSKYDTNETQIISYPITFHVKYETLFNIIFEVIILSRNKFCIS